MNYDIICNDPVTESYSGYMSKRFNYLSEVPKFAERKPDICALVNSH